MKIKIHNSYRQIVAISDSDLIGKYFHEGKKQLNITENFYNGKEISEKDLIEKLKQLNREDATFNIVGNNSVQTAIKAGIISEKGILKVQDVPFALVLL